jgi:hypothetical protein
MADWQRHLYLNPEWDQAKEGGISRQQLSASIAAKLRGLAPFPATLAELNEQREDIAVDFASMATEKDLSISDFDGQMCVLYDWGDERISPEWNGKKACWIDTMSRSPALPSPEVK